MIFYSTIVEHTLLISIHKVIVKMHNNNEKKETQIFKKIRTTYGIKNEINVKSFAQLSEKSATQLNLIFLLCLSDINKIK